MEGEERKISRIRLECHDGGIRVAKMKIQHGESYVAANIEYNVRILRKIDLVFILNEDVVEQRKINEARDVDCGYVSEELAANGFGFSKGSAFRECSLDC